MNEMNIIREALAAQISTIRMARHGNPKSYTAEELTEVEALFEKVCDTRHGEYVLYQP